MLRPARMVKLYFIGNCNDFYAEMNFDGTDKVIFCWKEESDEMRQIEGNINAIFEVEASWDDKNFVWKKLHSLLYC